jgi:hypothetical protein
MAHLLVVVVRGMYQRLALEILGEFQRGAEVLMRAANSLQVA